MPKEPQAGGEIFVQLRKELDETLRLALDGRAKIMEMRAAANASALQTAQLLAEVDALFARR